MKTTADLKALLGDINTEIVERRAAEEAARVAEKKERVGVVMQLLPLVTASQKAASAVRDQMYSLPEAKTEVREYLRGEFLSFSGSLLPHAAAQIAVAVGELSEVSAEKFAEIRGKNEAVYAHRKVAHEGSWKHGCPGCTMMFVQESKAEGVLHRYIALTHWSGTLLKERYDRNRPKLLGRSQVGPIGKAMASPAAVPNTAPAATEDPKPPSRKVRRSVKQTERTTEGTPTGRPRGDQGRGGARNLTLEAQSGADE